MVRVEPAPSPAERPVTESSSRIGTAPRAQRLPSLKSSPGHLIRVAQQVHTELWRRELGRGVTSVQYACLMAIEQAPGLDQQMLGARVSLDKATVADVVRRMHLTGLIDRVDSADDRRRRLLEPTPEGRRVRAAQLPAVLRVQEEILAPLSTSERTALTAELTEVAGLVDHSGDVPLGSRTSLYVAPGHLIRRAQQRHWSLWGQTVGTEVTSVQYGVLLGLHDSPAVGQVKIGSLASIDKSSIAEVLRRLDRRGLLEREPDPADGRRNLVAITPTGVQVVEELAPRVLEVQRLLFAPLDPAERTRFTTLMSKVCRIKD